MWCSAAAHPLYFNQISQGLDVISVAGEWLTAVTNTNMQVASVIMPSSLNNTIHVSYVVDHRSSSSSQKHPCRLITMLDNRGINAEQDATILSQ